MKKFDYKNLLYRSVIVILCVFLVGGVALGANNVLELEGTMVPVTNAESLSPLPQSIGETVDYINSAVAYALKEKPKLSGKTDIGIPDDEENGKAITIGTGDSPLRSAALYIRKSAADSLEDGFDEISADFGEGFEEKLWIPDINPDEVEDCDVDYIYYRCPSCGENYDEPAENCEKCGSERPLDMLYRDEYTITLNFADGNSALKLNAAKAPANGISVLRRNFRLRSAEDIDALIAQQTEDYFDYSVDSLNYTDVKIVAVINRLTDKITQLRYEKCTAVEMTARFKNEYSSLGAVPASFFVDESVKFDFTWPGVSMSEKKLSVEKKATEMLEATLTCSDPVNTDVVWSSSDESIAAVDSAGYVTAGKTDGTAVITATMEFQGKTYSDSCEVSVKTPVEKIDISKRSLDLTVGEAYTLTATVSPKKATVRSVTWYSTDESVAAVDQNGVITATGEGSAGIYALSDDGYYKATCEVEVTK